MNKRVRVVLAAVLLVLAVLTLVTASGCSARTVSVKTGERVVCSYGEQVSSTVRTIKVPAKEAGKYSVVTKTVTCPKHAQIEFLYAEAQTALEKQDFKTAQTKLAQIVSIDSSYKSAQEQLDSVKAGGKPAPDSSSGTTPGSASGSGTSTGTADSGGDGSAGDARPQGPVASLLIYTPDELAGYKPRAVGSDVFSVSREYAPLSKGTISSLTIYAEQFRTAQAARSWLAKSVKGAYTISARNVRVAGHDAYFGTDGRRFAVVAWADGPVAVAIEADAGSKPSDAYGDLVKVAGALPK